MIDVSDLRIGNMFCDNDKTVCYFAGAWNRKEGWVIRDSANNTYAQNDVYPIGLTPELLEKFGFDHGVSEGIANIGTELDDEKEDGDTHFWDIRIKGSGIVDGFVLSLVKWGEQDCFTFSNHWLRRRIKYLHELQNLYYALTGKELPLSTTI